MDVVYRRLISGLKNTCCQGLGAVEVGADQG